MQKAGRTGVAETVLDEPGLLKHPHKDGNFYVCVFSDFHMALNRYLKQTEMHANGSKHKTV